MAMAATYTHDNCPGVPKGAVVRVYTDKLAADQPAAWAHARKVNEKIYWDIQRKKLEERNGR